MGTRGAAYKGEQVASHLWFQLGNCFEVVGRDCNRQIAHHLLQLALCLPRRLMTQLENVRKLEAIPGHVSHRTCMVHLSVCVQIWRQ